MLGPKAYPCTSYWSPTDVQETSGHLPLRSDCRNASVVPTTACVANLTSEIAGDDSQYIMDVFQEFLRRKKLGGTEESPFLAALWLHTNHVPHPALPEWFHAYNDAHDRPAGDYLGTISQMDVQIGRLREMLVAAGVADNTMLWLTADNGAHVGGSDRDVNAASNGLRQCKGSLFEGGIRVAGLLEWPARIRARQETDVPAYVNDYLPTFLDIAGIPHTQPSWAADGISLLPVIDGSMTRRPSVRTELVDAIALSRDNKL